MSIAKVVEISSSSAQSFEDAIRQGIRRTSETVRDIEGAWVKEQKVVVEKGEITEFRVAMMISFIVHPKTKA